MRQSKVCGTTLCRVPLLRDYFDSAFFETTLDSVLQLLLVNIRKPPHLIPFFSSVPGRYRSSVHSSCLFSLFKAGCLFANDVEVLQNQILSLRTTSVPDDLVPGPTIKIDPSDKDAWCVTETPSVWATAYALRSLDKTGYDGPELETIGNATRWLISQCFPEGGWGYNRYPQTKPTVYLTSLSIKALAQCLRSASRYRISESDCAEGYKAISNGIQFILKCKNNNSKFPVPVFHSRPTENDDQNHWDIVSSVWSYQIIIEHGKRRERSIATANAESFFDFLHDEITKYPMPIPNAFIDETLTKYQRSKKYQYYMPSLLINLLNIGLPPLHPLAFSLLNWLRNTVRPDGVASDYHPHHATSFSTALGIQSIHAWSSALSKSMDTVQEMANTTYSDYPRALRSLHESQSNLQSLENEMQTLKQTNKRYFIEILVLLLLIVLAIVASFFSLIPIKQEIVIGVWGSLIGGFLIFCMQKGLSYLLNRDRRKND